MSSDLRQRRIVVTHLMTNPTDSTFAEGIYVLHVFEKKSQKTSRLDLDVARTRYAAVQRTRREE